MKRIFLYFAGWLFLCGATVFAAAWHIDPLFDYYNGRSPESVAAELAANDVDEVWYFAVTPDACRPELLAALKRSGIRTVLTVFPCWVYLSEADMDRYLPENWRDWQMQFTNPDAKKDRIFIGFVHPEYNRWYRSYVAGLVKKYGFDGVAMIETMYPCYNGFSYNPVLFGDVGPAMERAFGEPLPGFLNPAAADHYLNDRAKMARFVEFRAKTISDFYKYIADGVRAECPDVKIYTWALGVSESGGLNKIRFFNGSDTFDIVNAVQPDGHVVQTHWPDWCRSDLKPDYIMKYDEFAAAARRGCPGVRVGFQGDCGSLPEMRRSPEWVAANLTAAAGLFDFSVYYEFSIRDEVYSRPPELKSVKRTADGFILVFDQRLGDASAAVFTSANPWVELAEVDGNLLKVTVASEAAPQDKIDISGVCDDPAARLPLSGDKNEPRGRINPVPRGSLHAVIAVK